jgi:hypothetical protein
MGAMKRASSPPSPVVASDPALAVLIEMMAEDGKRLVAEEFPLEPILISDHRIRD